MDLGATLRAARKGRGLTLRDVSNRTNIPSHFLEAIERNALDELPGGLVTRGHLRAFAGEVGVDGHRLIIDGAADSATQIDLLQLLRARFSVADEEHNNIVQLLLVLACLAGLLYATTRHDSQHAASRDAVQEEQIGAPEES